MPGEDFEEWDVKVVRLIYPAVAMEVFGLVDPDERAYLARVLPQGHGWVVRWEVTPDGAVFVVEADLADVGRGGIQPLLRVPVSDRPGDLPSELLPAPVRAEIVELVAQAVAELPPIPDTVAELVGPQP